MSASFANAWLAAFATLVAALLLSSQEGVFVKLVAIWLLVANGALVWREARR